MWGVYLGRRKALGATSAWPCSYWADCSTDTLRSFVRHLSKIVFRLCPYDADNRNTGFLYVNHILYNLCACLSCKCQASRRPAPNRQQAFYGYLLSTCFNSTLRICNQTVRSLNSLPAGWATRIHIIPQKWQETLCSLERSDFCCTYLSHFGRRQELCHSRRNRGV